MKIVLEFKITNVPYSLKLGTAIASEACVLRVTKTTLKTFNK